MLRLSNAMAKQCKGYCYTRLDSSLIANKALSFEGGRQTTNDRRQNDKRQTTTTNKQKHYYLERL